MSFWCLETAWFEAMISKKLQVNWELARYPRILGDSYCETHATIKASSLYTINDSRNVGVMYYLNRCMWHSISMSCFETRLDFLFTQSRLILFVSICSISQLILQRRGSRKQNASAQNILIVFPLFVKRQIDQIFQILIRKSILFQQIWRWDSFIMWSGSASNSPPKRLCFCFVRIQSRLMVSTNTILRIFCLPIQHHLIMFVFNV